MKTLLLCCILFAVQVSAQTSHSNHSRFDGALEYQFNLLTGDPPLPSGTAPDVIAGYMYFKYLAVHENAASLDSAYSRVTYSDTLKTILKYLYTLDDYDPVLYHQFLYSRTHGAYASLPGHIHYVDIEPAVERLFPDTLRTAMLAFSDIIARVKITSTRVKVDTFAKIARHDILIKAQLLQAIKGQRIPSCIGDNMAAIRSNGSIQGYDSAAIVSGYSSSVPADSGACLQWEYSREWQRGVTWNSDFLHGMSMKHSDGSDWVVPDGEYIVFLSFHDNGHDTLTDFTTLWPARSYFGKSGGMYRVIEGVVQDPFDDFGCGTNPTVAVLMACLNSRARNILHF